VLKAQTAAKIRPLLGALMGAAICKFVFAENAMEVVPGAGSAKNLPPETRTDLKIEDPCPF
jgi:hypothetical protein